MLTLLMTLLTIADIPRDDLKDMEGTWVLVSTADGPPGQKLVKPADRRFKLVVKGKTIQASREARKGMEGTLTLDSTEFPKRIDSFYPDSNHLAGIYELNGDILRLSSSPPGQDRPTSFSETGTTVAIYEREKPRP